MKYVLLTRSITESQNFKKALRATSGKNVLISPLLTIKLTPQSIDNIASYSALIFTSTNAVRSFCKANQERTIPVYNVGLRTHKVLKQEGFETIHTVQNSARELLSILGKNNYDKPLLYCRGDFITHDLKGLITSVDIEERIFYKSEQNQTFTPEAEKSLIKGNISDCVFFSKRTIDTFYSIIKTHPDQQKILDGITRTRLLCLSDDMIEYALKLADDMKLLTHWQSTLKAKIPTQDAMIEVLR